MYAEEGLPKTGNPKAYRCRFCGKTRRIRFAWW